MKENRIEKKEYPPGDFGIWVVIYVELITFGLFFVGYAFDRKLNLEMFNQSQQILETTSGFANTLILVTSSYFVAKGAKLISTMNEENFKEFNQKAAKWTLFALLCGIAFLVNKMFEFSNIFGQGISLSTNNFFMFYIMLTGFHFMHVGLGSVILFNLYQKTKKNGYLPKDNKGFLSGASYWHMVDFLWIVLFPLVYIIH